MNLSEKYRPKTIDAFIGLDKPKLLLQSFVASPTGGHFLFVGRPGSGKTAMAEALATALSADLIRMPANECTRGKIGRLADGQLHLGDQARRRLILVDQADALTERQQSGLRPILEGYIGPTEAMWVFTATDATDLDDGFKSRLHQVKFSSHGNAPAVTAFLEKVWAIEATNLDAPPPNFARIVKEAKGSIRDCLNVLSNKLMMSEHTNP